jgi:alpha-1,3-rhamnosyl/mannosyltransferase
VLVGEGLHDEIIRLEATIQECARPRMLVQITGYLQGESLRAAYAEAAGLVFPSLCESFGIPVLEAMSQNCPLALANSTSLPEIAGEAAFYFDPTSEEAIASSIRQLIDDQTGVEERIEIGKKLVAQYSWKKSVDDLLQAIRNRS